MEILMFNKRKKWSILSTLIVVSLLFVIVASASAAQFDQWLSFGGGPENQHMVNRGPLDKNKVQDLQLEWNYPAGGYISSPPSSTDGILYFTDHGGGVHAVDGETGQPIWSTNTKTNYSDLGTSYIAYSRNTPAIAGDYLVIGSQHALFGPDNYWQDMLVPSSDPAYDLEFDIGNPNRYAQGAWLLIIDRHTGELVTKVQIDDHPLAMVTQSPIVVDDKIYVGVSTQSSVIAGFDPSALGFLGGLTLKPYPCCTFYGNAVAVDISDINNPQLDWKFYTATPELDSNGNVKAPADRTPGLYSGASVWGGQMAYDAKNHRVYFGTGNNHSLPDAVIACFAAAVNDTTIDPETCDDPTNSVASIIGLDAADGSLVWRQQVAADAELAGYDPWNTSCGVPNVPIFGFWTVENCPGVGLGFRPGPDLDIGQGAMLGKINDQPAVLIGQKSGDFWALNADTGAVIWNTQVSPGALDGGFQWNAATDGKRIYASSANSGHQEWTLVNPPANSSIQAQTFGGFWSGLDVKSGEILWQTTGTEPNADANENHGELTLVNNVVFAGSYTGYMRAFDAKTGTELWRFYTGDVCGNDSCARSVNTAPTIINGDVYWGYGYSASGVGFAVGNPQLGSSDGTNLLKFSLP
jgi:polyvinyl alcohol dehydrogenase (cytochrome)